MSYRYAGKSKYRPQTVRKRQRRRIKRLTVTGLILILLIALIVTVNRINASINEHRAQEQLQAEINKYIDTFQPGVSVNGVELTGYSYDEARQALNDRYADSLNRSIRLSFGEKSWTLTPAQVGARIDLEDQLAKAWAYGKEGADLERLEEIRSLADNPVDLSAELTFDAEALRVFVEAIRQEIDCEPVNATRQLVDREKFVFTDSSIGYRLDSVSLIAQLEDAILNGGAEEIEIQPEIIQPSPSRTELEAATVLLAECTTSLKGSSTSRNNNVNLALGYFNFLVVEPGDSVSFNRIVGKRTKENGFYEAPEYAGTTVVTGVGGGVCQASTTVYGAVIRAGLEIRERHPHTMTVGYVEASQDAAVNNDDKNLRFKNNTGSELFFFAWTNAKEETATVKIYGKPVDSNTRIDIISEVTQIDIHSTQITYEDDVDGVRIWYVDDPPVLYSAGKPGMKSTAYRVYYDLTTGTEIRRERLSSDYYAPQNDVYLRGVHPRG